MKTNFDEYLNEQKKDPAFLSRFEQFSAGITTREEAEGIASKLEVACVEARYAARLLRRNWKHVAERPDMVLRITRLVEAVQ